MLTHLETGRPRVDEQPQQQPQAEQQKEEKKRRQQTEEDREEVEEEKQYVRERGHRPKGERKPRAQPLCMVPRSHGFGYAFSFDGTRTESAEMFVDIPGQKAVVQINVTITDPYPLIVAYRYYARADLVLFFFHVRLLELIFTFILQGLTAMVDSDGVCQVQPWTGHFSLCAAK